MGTLLLPKPHTGQRIVRQEAKRFNYLAAGRRWRKTTLAVTIAVEFAVARKSVLWTAPTFSQIEIAWTEFKKGCITVAKFNETKKTITFPGGGVVVFRSLDEPDNARGFTADLIVVDEAGDVKEIAWFEVLRPMLMDTGGVAWVLGTPKRRNWFWREHVKAKMYDDSMSWQIPTLGCEVTEYGLVRKPHRLENPNIRFSELVRMYQNQSERSFRQEILAEFLEDTGGVFRNVRKVATGSIINPYWGNFVGGIDWADNKDYTVISIFDMDKRKQVDMLRFNQIGYQLQEARIEGMNTKWKPLFMFGELNSMGKPVIQSLQAKGLPIIGFETNSATKPKLIRNHALNLEKMNIQLLNDEFLIAEHEAYESITMKTGYVRYQAPEGMHDDIVMSCAFGSHAFNTSAIEGIDQSVINLFANFTGK